MRLQPRTRSRLLFDISPVRMEGPEHPSFPRTRWCARWLFGGWFWKRHPPLLRSEMPRGASHQTRRGVSAAQLEGLASPPKPGRGEPVFLGHSHSLQGPWPHRGDISVQLQEPCSPSAENWVNALPPPAACSPSLCIWAPTSKVRHGEDALTAGIGASAPDIYLITESEGARGAGGDGASVPT